MKAIKRKFIEQGIREQEDVRSIRRWRNAEQAY
jgi:hypothetical protein